VELLVHVPTEEKPFRQVAFAKSPLLNLDGVYDRVCPVKFVYQHPEIKPTTAIEFLQDADGKLHGRRVSGRKCTANGEVTTGSRLQVPGGFTLIMKEYLPHAQRQISFASARPHGGTAEMLEPAAEVEISLSGTSEKVWLQRSHLEFQRRTIATPNGPLHVEFGNTKSPLGFSLRLIDCYGNPTGSRRASAASNIHLIDDNPKVDAQKQITTTQPLKHEGFTFYQSDSRDAGHGKQASILRVVYDPGRPLKVAGMWMILLGLAMIFFIRAYWSIGVRHQWQLPAL
jgi:hypothetical protein